jgi:hypothetical protein
LTFKDIGQFYVGLVLVVPKRAAQAGFPGCPVGDDDGDLLVVEAMDRSLSSC